MDFDETLRQFAVKASGLQAQLQNEQATKNALIMPFFQLLGYDVFNPAEFFPEYVADVGIKKGEKVDYVVMKNDMPIMLIEAKKCGEDLNIHTGQLFRYFSVTTAKIGILTDGIKYKFYTDLELQNKMDLSPFFEFNLEEITDEDIVGIKKFCKDNFDIDKIIEYAFECKYSKLIKSYFMAQMQQTTEEFVNFILGAKVNNVVIYGGTRTQNIIDKFKSVIQKSLINLVNDESSNRISAALSEGETAIKGSSDSTVERNHGYVEKTFLQRLESATSEIKNLYFSLKDYILSLGNDITVNEWKFYVAFKKEKNFACIERLYKDKIQIFLRISPDSVILVDNFIRDARKIPVYGSCDLMVIIRNNDDFEKAKSLIVKAYNEN